MPCWRNFYLQTNHDFYESKNWIAKNQHEPLAICSRISLVSDHFVGCTVVVHHLWLSTRLQERGICRIASARLNGHVLCSSNKGILIIWPWPGVARPPVIHKSHRFRRKEKLSFIIFSPDDYSQALWEGRFEIRLLVHPYRPRCVFFHSLISRDGLFSEHPHTNDLWLPLVSVFSMHMIGANTLWLSIQAYINNFLTDNNSNLSLSYPQSVIQLYLPSQ